MNYLQLLARQMKISRKKRDFEFNPFICSQISQKCQHVQRFLTCPFFKAKEEKSQTTSGNEIKRYCIVL